MKILLALVLVAGVGFAAGSWMISQRLNVRHAAELAEQQTAWQSERATLTAALEEARSRAPATTGPAVPASPIVPAGPAKLSPTEIVARLTALRFGASNQTRSARQAVYWLEELIATGPAALPAIRQFLARNEELDFAAPNPGKGGRGVSGDFIVPPSLRFGLFDAARQIGGPEAETLLAEVLSATGRGAELAWLARALQEIAPGKYRDTALAAARELLTRPPAANPLSPLDRNERDQLFGVLLMYNDTSYASAAQSQVLRADGEVDRSALKYLQQSLGQQAVGIAAQWYDDPRITDPAKKEPFARLALNFVGADAQADAFYQKAINDFALPKDQRRNLIEDLNQDGFPDTRNLSTRDLPLIQSRLALIEQLAPNAADAINAAAFKEAYKDLLKMRERVSRPPQAVP